MLSIIDSLLDSGVIDLCHVITVHMNHNNIALSIYLSVDEEICASSLPATAVVSDSINANFMMLRFLSMTV